MSKPAARKGDDHSCPKKDSGVPHVGGPISGGSGDVFINDKPAARVGDPAQCHGPDDAIAEGSSTVFIDGNPAAREGDATEHGGKITEGSGNVFIGSGGNPVHIGGKGTVNIGNTGQVFIGGGSVAAILQDTKTALEEAMRIEGVSPSSYESLAWIIKHESGGRVNVRNNKSSARGLFQLTKANYQFNPNGENSFGNAVEECQGGIRYIKNRYGTPENAVEFWKKHEWY